MPARSTTLRPHPAATLLLAPALALAMLLAACGAPSAPGDDDPPDTALVTRVVVEPAGFLLAAPGASQALTATAFAEDGTVVDVAIVWETTGSGVAVDATGIATATAAVGSATIVARAEGVASAPALTVVASAVVGAVLVDDADVAGLEAVDDAEAYGLGWRYAAVLRSARPVVGDLVIGTGLLPLGGRVVAVSDVAAGRRVVLELVDLDDLFDDLRIDVDVAIDPADLVLEPEVLTAFEVERRADGTIRLTARPDTAASLVRTLADDDKFSLGPFQCKTEDVELPIFSLARPPEIELNPTLALQLAYDRALGGLQKMGIRGSLQLTIKYEPSIGAAFEGTLACTRKLATWTLPIGGPLAFVIGAQVPVGVGFDLKGKLVVAQAALDAQFVGRASAEAGIDCTGSDGCVPYGTATMTTDTFAFRPVFPDVDAQFRADLSLYGFGYADIALGSALLDRFPFLEDALKLELVRVRAGIEQTLSLATLTAQADNPTYASGATTLLKSDIKIGSEIPILERFEKLLKVKIKPLTITLPTVELWGSPSGSFAIAPTLVRPGSDTEPGQLATFTVTIQESSSLGLTAVSVETVELRWRRAVDGGGTTLAPGRGACFRLPRTSPSQTTFSCETDFTEDHLGEQAFYAFANVRLFGVPLPVPIELAPNSRRSLLVSDERRPIDPSNAVAIGQFHGIAVRDDGTVWGWGRSTFNPGTYDPAPQRVPGIDDVVGVAIGGLWSLALRADGSVWQWDLSGVVPSGVACARCVPGPLSELDDVASIYGGHGTAFAVTADGSLWGWGSNGTAELGIGGFGFEDFPYPVTGLPPVATVAPGYGHTVAVAANGGVWGWGATRYAQTGQRPLDVDDENFRREIEYPEPAEVGGLARVAGGSEFSIAITTGGGLVSWGSRFGALGYVVEEESRFVLPPRTVPVAQPVDIAASVQNAYVVDADGVVWAWGANSFGALGSGTTEEDRPSPGPVAGLPLMAAVWANHYTVAALGRDGSVWTWGKNDYGQAGSEPAGPCARPLNTTWPCQATPVEILSLDTGP